MTKPESTTKIPAPIYAAAGAGDLAIERLRKLPERVAQLQDRLQAELPGRITVLQDKITQRVAELPALVAELRQRVVDADADKLREGARRNAQLVLTNAQAAQEKAAAIYAGLVARGEQVVGRGTPGHGTQTVVAEVIAAPGQVSVPAPAGEVLEGDLTGTPTARKRPASRGRKAH